MPYTVVTRSSVRPLRSMAAMVFSKPGGAGSFAMRSTSARFSVMAASSAGPRCSGRARSNGGTPPNGPSQGASSGFAAVVVVFCFMSAAPATAEPASSPTAATPASIDRACIVDSFELTDWPAVGRLDY
jgi:hypothetical protein